MTTTAPLFLDTTFPAYRACVLGAIWTSHAPTGTLHAYAPTDDAGDGNMVVDHAIVTDTARREDYLALILPRDAAIAGAWAERTDKIVAAAEVIAEDYTRDSLLPPSPVVEGRISALAAAAGVTIDQAAALLAAVADDLSDRGALRRTLRTGEPGAIEARAAAAALTARIDAAVLAVAPDSPEADGARARSSR